MNDFEKYLTETIDEIKTVLLKKNADYDLSFFKTYKKHGILSSIIRLEDKFNRLENLTAKNNKAQVTEESVDDTLRDLVGYGILSLVMRKMERNQ
jgi:Domain of Unknown Function (DUF1599).